MKNKIFILLWLMLTIKTQAQNPYFEISKQMEIYNDVLKHLATNYIDEINFGDLIQKNTTKMLNGLDRFTTYYDEQGILDQKMRQEGHFGGLGIGIRIKDSAIVVTRIYKNTPAVEKLKVGDKITEVSGKKIYEVDNKVASQMLRGEKGSKVSLTLIRNGKTIQTEIERSDIALDAVTYSGTDGDIGYIRFVKFNKKASAQVKKAILDLKKQGAKKLIIDVRGNPGGLLNEVIKIVNFFIPKGKVVVTTKGRFEKFNKTYSTRRESLDEEIPVVILVNNHSASASEILSGSLQDYDRAVIIGDTTYGKGLVQRTFKLAYGTYMKQTISKYYIPSGRLIQKIDYWHRDKKGKPLLMRDNLKEKEFKTENGRIVHNLGGVVPDIEVDTRIKESLIKDLSRKNAIFDFATRYYYTRNKPQSAALLKLTDKDFTDFLNFIKQEKYKPKQTSQKLLQNALKQAKKDKLPLEIINSYKKVLAQYENKNREILQQNKKIILDLITRDLQYRYFYIDGYTQYLLQTDPVILKAKDVLNNENMYKKILQGK